MRTFYQLRITLEGIKPPIGRIFLVDSQITLDMFHNIIQNVMGWKNEHLWAFESAEGSFGPDAGIWDTSKKEAKKYFLSEILKTEKDVCKYIYDFGDFWQHKLEVEQVLTEREIETNVPTCISGERACPPEDCGGIWGYSEILEVFTDPDHADYEDVMALIGYDFNPDFFDKTAVNKKLERYRT